MLDSIGDKGVPGQGTESKKSQNRSLRGCPLQERCHQGHGEKRKEVEREGWKWEKGAVPGCGRGGMASQTLTQQSLPLKAEMSPEAFCGKQEEDSLGQYGNWWGAMLPLLL